MDRQSARRSDESPKPQEPPPQGGHTVWLGLVTLGLIAALIMVIYLMALKHDFLLTNGDQIFSNSSRIFIYRPNVENPETIITLEDVHAVFGFANYSCDPHGDIQFVDIVPSGNIIGLDDSWVKIVLRSTIENTATDIINLESDKIMVNLTEPGGYLAHIYIITAGAVNFNDTITVCSFLEVNSTGLFDDLRRVAPTCNGQSAVMDTQYGPLIVTDAFDAFSIKGPGFAVVRYLVTSPFSSGQVGVILARLRLVKI
jgi:hypothetical protein